jgi:hypothetical protein
MKTQSIRLLSLVVLSVSWSLSNQAVATFHQWDIVEAYTSLDGSVQFIEMFNDTTFNSENLAFTQSGGIFSSGNSYSFPTDLPAGTANKTFLVGTNSYDAIAQVDVNVPVPDYVVVDNFFSTSGDTLELKWFTSSVFDTLIFTAGQLPTDGINSLNHAFGDSGNSSSSLLNSPTNFAGDTGSVTLAPPSADFDGDNDVDGDDFLFWQLFLGGADDLALWETQYGLPVPLAGVSAVPEPQSVCLLLCGLLGFCRRCR